VSQLGHPLRTVHPPETDGTGALAGQTVVLRPSEPAHVKDFLRILTEPSVARWWPGYDLARVSRELVGPHCYAVEAYRETVGLIMFDEDEDPEYRHAGVDIALHADAQGQGLGADAVRTLVRHLMANRGHHRIVIDPSADNEKAIRSYERVGFRRVGVMRAYERGRDGTWHDGLLMDLLAEDLR
jgi:aminoglycoside 6'-N-acetyltransferase